jgi:hypothetical protein
VPLATRHVHAKLLKKKSAGVPGETGADIALNKGGSMAQTHLPPSSAVVAELNQSLARGEKDLEILDVHALELSEVEHEILQDMKRKDREYKDSHFHSIPKPTKHIKP